MFALVLIRCGGVQTCFQVVMRSAVCLRSDKDLVNQERSLAIQREAGFRSFKHGEVSNFVHNYLKKIQFFFLVHFKIISIKMYINKKKNLFFFFKYIV